MKPVVTPILTISLACLGCSYKSSPLPAGATPPALRAAAPQTLPPAATTPAQPRQPPPAAGTTLHTTIVNNINNNIEAGPCSIVAMSGSTIANSGSCDATTPSAAPVPTSPPAAPLGATVHAVGTHVAARFKVRNGFVSGATGTPIPVGELAGGGVSSDANSWSTLPGGGEVSLDQDEVVLRAVAPPSLRFNLYLVSSTGAINWLAVPHASLTGTIQRAPDPAFNNALYSLIVP